jgi:hypothetical protein
MSRPCADLAGWGIFKRSDMASRHTKPEPPNSLLSAAQEGAGEMIAWRISFEMDPTLKERAAVELRLDPAQMNPSVKEAYERGDLKVIIPGRWRDAPPVWRCPKGHVARGHFALKLFGKCNVCGEIPWRTHPDDE